MGADNPQRQGLQSAVAGQGDPLNIIREEPECSDPSDPAACSALQYSPLWDVTPVAWTQAAIDAGERVRLNSHQKVEQLFQEGELVNANPGGPEQMDLEIEGLRGHEVDGDGVGTEGVDDDETVSVFGRARELEAGVAERDRDGRVRAVDQVGEVFGRARDGDDRGVDLVERPTLVCLRVGGGRARAEADDGDVERRGARRVGPHAGLHSGPV